MTEVYVNGIGILAPGLLGWPAARAVLAGVKPYVDSAVPEPPAALLPANERRRASAAVKWALEVAQAAVEQAQIDPTALTTVFTTSGGETAVFDKICSSLAGADRAISPTLFHHSVHNAASGYWGIGTQSRQSSTALAAYDASFCAGLLEAHSLVCTDAAPVLLIAYDLPAPPPLYAARPLLAGFAAALVLSSQANARTLARLSCTLAETQGGQPLSTLADPGLEKLRTGNPGARALPLLAGVAAGGDSEVRLEYLDGLQVRVAITSCASA
jgi:hypothetical protein